jgi:cytochrome c-type biogenesis protein CcmH/NrfG
MRVTRSGRSTRGSTWCRKRSHELRAALALDARHFRANLLLGRILTLRGEAAAAVPYLKTAVAVQPSPTEAKQFLAEALKK